VAAQLCAGLLQACDDVRILATSRERLRIAGEAAYRLTPLPVPGPGEAGGDGAGAEAVRLFTDRARAADAGFALTVQNRADVARLVRRLDEMPLAIELAGHRHRGREILVCLRGGRGPRQRPGVPAALLKLAILPACLAVAAAQPARSRRGRWTLGSPNSEGAARRDRAWPGSARWPPPAASPCWRPPPPATPPYPSSCPGQPGKPPVRRAWLRLG